MTSTQSPKKTVDQLLELLSQEVEARTDAEVLAAALEEGVDIRARAKQLRQQLDQALVNAKSKYPAVDERIASRAETARRASYAVTKGGVGPMTLGETSLVNWTNKSVLTFASGVDPLKRMTEKAEQVVVQALEAGWDGPPYDPFKLAQLLKIKVAPRSDVVEARTVRDHDDQILIEFNPNLPVSRTRFSVAHEIAHTFFQDCLERARYRARRETYSNDDWQLEMLCNVGAAEILMPPGSFFTIREEGFDVVRLMELRKELGVSTEALLLRAVKLARTPIACFVASRRGSHLRADYAVFSPVWPTKRIALPQESLANRCSAIGSIAKGQETWTVGGETVQLDVQAVGLPPYAGQEHFRVAGLIRPKISRKVNVPSIEYLEGDVLKPRGEGPKVVAHIVNDATPRWGGKGVAAAIKGAWPDVQEQFKTWALTQPAMFRLGGLHLAPYAQNVWVASMVAQHGYGPSERPRIRYAPLERCLAALAEFATEKRASVHMPRIGQGYGQGNWGVIEELVDRLVCARGVRAFVYQLPGTGKSRVGNA